MVALGQSQGLRTVAGEHGRPLGRAVGNALEVEEALATLGGEGPADLVAVTLALGTEILIGGAAATTDEARRR